MNSKKRYGRADLTSAQKAAGLRLAAEIVYNMPDDADEPGRPVGYWEALRLLDEADRLDGGQSAFTDDGSVFFWTREEVLFFSSTEANGDEVVQ